MLTNSLDTNPRCELVFHPITPGKISFFAVVALMHEPSGETVMYASTGLKKVNSIITCPSSWYPTQLEVDASCGDKLISIFHM